LEIAFKIGEVDQYWIKITFDSPSWVGFCLHLIGRNVQQLVLFKH